MPVSLRNLGVKGGPEGSGCDLVAHGWGVIWVYIVCRACPRACWGLRALGQGTVAHVLSPSGCGPPVGMWGGVCVCPVLRASAAWRACPIYMCVGEGRVLCCIEFCMVWVAALGSAMPVHIPYNSGSLGMFGYSVLGTGGFSRFGALQDATPTAPHDHAMARAISPQMRHVAQGHAGTPGHPPSRQDWGWKEGTRRCLVLVCQ